MRRLSTAAVGLLALPLLLACRDDVTGPGSPGPADDRVASIEVVPNTVNLRIGGAVDLHAILRNAEGRVLSGRYEVTWTSSDPLVARVSDDGRVTAFMQGYAQITASSDGRSTRVGVRVIEPFINEPEEWPEPKPEK